jgi:hypothetical protein
MVPTLANVLLVHEDQDQEPRYHRSRPNGCRMGAALIRMLGSLGRPLDVPRTFFNLSSLSFVLGQPTLKLRFAVFVGDSHLT